MELECVKYHEKMTSAEAHCRHLNDYCKYRSSCIIHYMEKENSYENSRSGNGKNKSEKKQKNRE